MDKQMWRGRIKEAATIAGCAALIFVFSFIAAVLVLSLDRYESNTAPQGLTSATSSAEPAAPLSNPLNYAAVVCQDKCRYYMRSDK